MDVVRHRRQAYLMPLMVYICRDCGTKVEWMRLKRQKVGKPDYCHECNKKMTRVRKPEEQ